MIVDQPTPRPACDGDYIPFWDLIDHPTSQWRAAELAERYCGTCPMRDTCLMTTPRQDENWAPAAFTIRQQLGLIARRNATNAA